MSGSSSRLFHPYKSLGVLCGPVPFALRPMPKQRFVAVLCACGNVVHQYNAQTLRLISVSETVNGKINAIATDRLYVYVAYGNTAAALHLSRKVKYTYADGHTSPIKFLLPFGAHLITIDESSKLVVWDIETQEIYSEISHQASTCSISAICHPVTYMNKILLGSEQGRLRLVNIKSAKLVHEFDGWDARVTVLEQSPATDVVGVGLEDGRIVMHNIKYDETVITFRQDWGQVTALSFRTDGASTVLSGSLPGHVAVWDLDSGRLLGQMSDCHRGAVNSLQTIQSQPLMITGSEDNSLRTWIFDLPDGLARQLAERTGHSQAATCVEFHGQDGEMVYSSSLDGTVRAFSTWKDTKQVNLGSAGRMSRQKAKKKQIVWEQVRLPPVVAMATELARESQWDNVLCCHEGSPVVSTWTSRRKRLGHKQIIHDRFETQSKYLDSVALCCTVSSCGNLALIGYSSGHVDVWNMQSAIHRGHFTDQNNRAHDRPVTGVASDALNTLAITADSEGFMKFWRFGSKKLIKTRNFESGITILRLHRENNLLAFATEAKDVQVLDVECCRVVRRFPNVHGGKIIDLTFNPRGDWLLTCGRDGLLNVWQLKTATKIDCIRFEQPCIALSFSPSSEYLATCHEGQKGVYLWANKTIYEPEVPLKALANDAQVSMTSLPHAQISLVENEQGMGQLQDDSEVMEVDGDKEEPQNPKEGLLTLSGQPEPRWATLPNLDLIRQRNKPIEPPKKPKAAPFFLPMIANTDGFTFDIPKEAGDSQSKIIEKKRAFLEPQTEFGKMVAAAENQEERRKAFEFLKELGPAKIDAEIRGLEGEKMLKNFMKMIEEVLESKRHFELAHSYLAVFVKVHRSELSNIEVRSEVDCLLNASCESWENLDSLLVHTLGVVQWLKSALI